MIAENLQKVKATLKPDVRLVAVSKFHPLADLQEAYDAGQRVFGESHVQELVAKQEALPKDIEWHFIGHLQTNKVKYMGGGRGNKIRFYPRRGDRDAGGRRMARLERSAHRGVDGDGDQYG